MATIKREFIFISCISSALAAIFTLVALVTEQWIVTTNARWVNTALTQPNTVKYGLFQGYYTQIEPSAISIQLTMTCLLKENVCALLCGLDDDERYTLLRQIYNNDTNASQNNDNCPSVQRSVTYSSVPISTFASDETDDRKFINAGVWISTIFFLIFSIAMGLTASSLAIWNTVTNPVQAFFSILGLYISNAGALLCTILGMCLWGIMHLSVTFHDVGIYFTLVGKMTSDKTAHLGFSFWILIISVVFYCNSIVLLYVRQYLLSKDPGHKMVQREDIADPGIYLY